MDAARLRSDPHVALAAGAALVVAAEYGYRTWPSDAWLFLQGGIALAALLAAWRAQERLRLAPLLGIAVAFHLAIVMLHLALGVPGDPDSRVGGVFDRQGHALLDGDYPRSEYPVGAVLLFAFEVLVSGGETRTANALLMIPFQLAVLAGIWICRTRFSPWLAAVVALWPANAFYWEHRFDLVPAALLVAGLALALRQRWTSAGVVLGAGALVKWTPGLAAAALVVWLIASGQARNAARHGLAFAVTVALVYVPFLLWSPSEVLAAYTRQGAREITPESLWYLPLRLFDEAYVRTHISFSAGAPHWANIAAAVLQVLLVLGVLLAAARIRGNRGAGVALAGIAPVVFLLTNRIFSPQFLVVIVAAWAVAGALLVRTRVEQLLLGLAVAGASFVNAFVYPFALPYYDVTWVLCSVLLFAIALVATGWIVLRALTSAAPRAR